MADEKAQHEENVDDASMCVCGLPMATCPDVWDDDSPTTEEVPW